MEGCRRIFLAGVNCVGKSTVGRILADLLDVDFYDLDLEAQRITELTISKLGWKYNTPYDYRKMMSGVLRQVINDSDQYVVALNPPGLMSPIWQVVDSANGIVVLMKDTPENIMRRTCFFDKNNNKMIVRLGKEEKKFILKEINDDLRFFNFYFSRADKKVDISGCDAKQAAMKIYKEVCQ